MRFLSRRLASKPPTSVVGVHPLALIAAIDSLPTGLAQAAIAESLAVAPESVFPLLAQRWADVAPRQDPFAALPTQLPSFGWLSTERADAERARRAWVALVGRWADLPKVLSHDLQARFGPILDAAARYTLVHSSDPATLFSFIMATDQPALRLAVLDLHPLAFAGDPTKLVRMVAAAREVGDVDSVVAAARGFAKHRSLAPVAAALSLADRVRLRSHKPLAAWLESEARVGSGAVRAALRRGTEEVSWVRALELALSPAWRSACLTKLTGTPNPIQFSEICEVGHLLENPQRAAALREAFRRLSVSRVLPPASGRSVGAGAARLAWLLPRANEQVHQRVALEPLARLWRAASTTLVPADPHPSVARTRFLFSSPAGTLHEAGSTLRAGLRSGVGSGMVTPAGRGSRMPKLDWESSNTQECGFPQVSQWSAEDHTITSPSGTFAGFELRRRLERDRQSALGDLRRSCEIAPSEAHIALVGLIRRIGVVAELAGWLASLALRPIGTDRRAAATAVAALGDADGPVIRKLLAVLCENTDDRIRANAVESAGRLIRRGDHDALRLVEIKPDPHHRVRANAIRSRWFADSTCVSDLFSMLADDRVSHRLASAWSCRRVPLGTGETARLRQVASVEVEPRVRQLLVEAIDRSTCAARLAWRSQSVTPSRVPFAPRLVA